MYYAVTIGKMKHLRTLALLSCFLSLAVLIPCMHSAVAEDESDSFSTQSRKRAAEHRQHAYELQQEGDLDNARSFYKLASELDPHSAIILNDLGIVYETKGDFTHAREYYLKALDEDETYLPTYTNLAYLCERRGDMKQAAEYWVKRISLGAQDDFWTQKAWDNLRRLSSVSSEAKKIHEKFEHSKMVKEMRLQQALLRQQHPPQKDTVRAQQDLETGKQLLAQGQYAAALQTFGYALSLDPDNSALNDYYQQAQAKVNEESIREHTVVGMALYRAGYYESARDQFDKALTLIPAEPNHK